MKLVLFCHPPFLPSQSMPRFARMVGQAMQARGCEVSYWAPTPVVYPLLAGTRLAKWAGYADQYLVFPVQVKWRLMKQSDQTLYVFCDQALGPWVPLVRHLPHVVHAHDLLALRSALGLIARNPTSLTGRIYQRYIRRGFQQARNFICVSRRTQADLVAFGQVRPELSEVVYNGLNYPYKRVAVTQAVETLKAAGLPASDSGMLLHVGGGQWYKNTAGVIRLYASYARVHASPLPLWMISPQPTSVDVIEALREVPAQGQVLFYQGISNATMEAAYSLARAMLFPSLAEGFGWPIVEAMACGCPVITSNDSPMNEIGGDVATYLPVPDPLKDLQPWAQSGAARLQTLLDLDADALASLRERSVAWASQFTTEAACDRYLDVYRQVLRNARP